MVHCLVRKPVGDTNKIKYNIFIRRPPEELSGGLQKSYLAASRKEDLSDGSLKSYLVAAERVIWQPPEELSGGRQKSYVGQSKISECFCI